MRVITGRYKGRRLSTVRNFSVRPATDRVKQTIFDILATRMDFEGATVLDLFAGSGSLGIEALSRGAEHVDFVEQMDEAADCIEQNLSVLGCLQASRVWRMDASQVIDRGGRMYDLIFADPPYEYPNTHDIPERVFAGTLLSPRGYLLIEHVNTFRFITTRRYQTGPERQFGRTVVTFFSHPARTTS